MYHWNIQIDDMVDAYLKYRNSESVGHCARCCEGHASMGAGGDMAAGLNEPPGTFQVEYIDVFGAFFSLSSWKFSLCFSECH